MGSETTFSKGFLEDGVMQAQVGIAVFSASDYTVKLANPVYLQMIGCAGKDVVGKPLLSVIPQPGLLSEPFFRRVISTGTSCTDKEVSITPGDSNGRAAWFNVVYQPLMNEYGQIHSIMVIANEVTGLVRAKRQAEEREKKFRTMVARSPVGMAVLRGSDYVIELANESMLADIWQKELGDVVGRKLLEVFPELEGQPFTTLLQQVGHTGAPCHEYEIPISLGGSLCAYIDADFAPLLDHGREVSAILITLYDVSEKVKMRKFREDNEMRLRMVIEASKLGTWELNLETQEFTCSDQYLANFGIEEQLSHAELLEFMHPDDRPLRKAAFKEAFGTGWLHYVSRLQWRDKSIHWIEAHGKVLYDDAGKPVRMIGTSRNITEEKVYQRHLQESEEKFRLLADSMPQFIWIADANGNLNYFNQSVFDYTGMSFDEIRGLGWIQFVHPEDRASNLHKWREAIRNCGDFLFEHRFRRYDGTYRWQLSRAIPHYDSHGEIRMWVGTSTDIHDQKAFAKELEEKVFERTKELKETNAVLEKTNRQLEQFAYIASHDLQEPLRKIQTFSDILKRNIHDQAAVNKYFTKIDSSARRMGELIKSVLDYSRLPAHPGQLLLTDLNEVVQNVKADLELMILEKGAVVESTPLPAIPGVPLQLNQLFSNLLGNALKFSREKPVIRIAATAVMGESLLGIFNADPSKRYVELIFSDNGIGFENKYKDQIFAIFQRLHGLQQYSGTGIGLALCKKIVENHYGHITAESEYEKGSTFRVYLPS